jgi:hypothetical protein
MKHTNTEGYFFIGLGTRYIEECYNLALTIKKQKDYRPIAIMVNEADLDFAKSKNVFDIFINFKIFDDNIRCLCHNYFEKNCLYPRLYLPEYTPFDETIIVDSDVLCQYSPNKIWNYVKNKNFPVQMVGYKDDPSWQSGNIHKVSEAFGKHVPCVHGGFFYINKKDDKTKDFFDYVKNLIFRYDEFKCPRGYPNFMVDEILFAITHAHFEISPIEFDEFPIMTFNYDDKIEIPSTLQTYGKNNTSTYLNSPIPFIHMFDKLHGQNYNYILNKILNY